MRILYAIQATGNGHLARAREIIPALAQKANIDIFISGIQGDLSLPYPVSYQKHGLSFIFGRKGKVDILKTIHSIKPIRLWQDIRDCPVEHYDLVIHDFEPITAHACKRKGIPNVSLSHQASFTFLECPRPLRKNHYAEWLLRHYAPGEKSVGLHFHPYHPEIFTPIIRRDIRNLLTEDQNHVVVYLPAYCPFYLASIFEKISEVSWKIFSKHHHKAEVSGNIEIFPVGTEIWLESLRTCRAAMVGAGFEGPSEIMFLGKKLLAIPMKNQYEQQCNAAALKQIGIKTMSEIDNRKRSEIKDWLTNDSAKVIQFSDNAELIIDHIVKVS